MSQACCSSLPFYASSLARIAYSAATHLRRGINALWLQARWKLHPDKIVTHRFKLAEAGEAYRLAAAGECGKVVILPNEP